jgi:hypothetical protein
MATFASGGYWSYNGDGDVELHNTARGARREAEFAVDGYTEQRHIATHHASDDYFPPEIRKVCWGVVVQRVAEFEPDPDHADPHEDFPTQIDFRLTGDDQG